MRLQNWVFLGILLAGTGVCAADAGEGTQWLHATLGEGGASSPKAPNTSQTTEQWGIPESGVALDTFRDAYYFYFARPGGGGTDYWDERGPADALKLAQSHEVSAPDAHERFRKFRMAYQDRFSDVVKKAELDLDKFNKGRAEGHKAKLDVAAAFMDADKEATKTAKQVSENSRGGSIFASSSRNVRDEILEWAVRDKNLMGGGLTQKQAEDLAVFAQKSWNPTEGLDRLSTHKFTAIRAAMQFASATVPGGGLGLSSDGAIAVTKELVKKDRAVDRVEIFRDTFHRLIITTPRDGKDFATFKKEVIDVALKAALTEHLPSQTGGGGGNTPTGAKSGG